ncbi:hypothetical protein RI367_003682 [Sorochytrium milnesiophthora]
MVNSDTALPPSLLKHPLLHMSSSARLPTKIVSFKRPNWTLYMSAREALAEFAAASGRLLSFVGVWPCVFQPIRLTGKYVEAPWTLGRFYEERKLPWDLNYCPGNPHLLFASTLGFQWASDEMRHVNELMVDRTLYTYFKYPDIDILLLIPLLTNDRGIRNLSNVTGAEIRVCYRLPFFNHTLDSQYNMPPICTLLGQFAIVWLSRQGNSLPAAFQIDTAPLGERPQPVHSGEKNPLLDYLED